MTNGDIVRHLKQREQDAEAQQLADLITQYQGFRDSIGSLLQAAFCGRCGATYRRS